MPGPEDVLTPALWESTAMLRDPQSDPVARRMYRVLLMVHHFHRRGYRRCRDLPRQARRGCTGGATSPTSPTSRQDNGTRFVDFKEAAIYTTFQGNAYFGWRMPPTPARHWPTGSSTASRRSPASAEGRDSGPTPAGTSRCSASPSGACFPIACRLISAALATRPPHHRAWRTAASPMPPGGEAPDP